MGLNKEILPRGKQPWQGLVSLETKNRRANFSAMLRIRKKYTPKARGEARNCPKKRRGRPTYLGMKGRGTESPQGKGSGSRRMSSLQEILEKLRAQPLNEDLADKWANAKVGNMVGEKWTWKKGEDQCEKKLQIKNA